jgi:dynein assembly factor 5
MEKIGEYIGPANTLSLILPSLVSGGGGLSTFRLGCLRALQGVIKGIPKDVLESQMPTLLDTLSEKELLQNENIQVMHEVAICLLHTGQKLSRDQDVIFPYFMILVQLESVPGNEKIVGWSALKQSVDTALTEHAKYLGVSVQDLYLTHLDGALRILSQSFEHWSQYSVEPRVLQTILFPTGAKFAAKLDALLPIFVANVAPEKDYELREKMLRILLHLFGSFPLSKEVFSPYFLVFLKDIILRSCIWRAGRKATVIRNLATELFGSVLKIYNPLEIVPFLQPVFRADIVPILASNLDDDEQTTRENCLFILGYLLQSPVWDADSLKKLYPELIKRMDDAKDSVRIKTAMVWTEFFKCVKIWMVSVAHYRAEMPFEDQDKLTLVKDGLVIELGLESGHYETIMDSLLLHMDDTNHLVQEVVCLALISGRDTVLPSDPLRDRIHASMTKHRSSMYLERLL